MIDITKTKEIAWELGQKLGEVVEDAYKQGFDDGSKDKQQTKGEWLFKEVTEEYHVIGQCSKCKERRRIDNYCSNCGSYNGDREVKP